MLRKLFEFGPIGSTHSSISIHGPYHAPHLHRDIDVKRIVGCQHPRVRAVLDRYSPCLPVMSTSTGKWFSGSVTSTEILTNIVSDILNKPLRLSAILDGCCQYVKDWKAVRCRVITCGPSTIEAVFVKALRADTYAEILIRESDYCGLSSLRLNQASRTSRRPKLAVVGMAGRFPNAPNHEDFWSLLYDGRDVHREVCSLPILSPLSFAHLTRYRKIALM